MPGKTDPAALSGLLPALASYRGGPATVMEVCGTHTVAVARLGLKPLLPGGVKLISGPGCPVCVTPVEVFDRAIWLAAEKGATLATFGDGLRVPGSSTNLMEARARGAKVLPVYSPVDALEHAKKNPGEEVVFLGLGFETTSPSVAYVIKLAAKTGVGNFSVLSAHKALMPAMEILASDPEMKVNAFLCPGHASMVLGSRAYEPLAARFKVPCVVAGFEPKDVLIGMIHILKQLEEGKAEVENTYPRAVTPEGNPQAVSAIAEVFELADTRWRGLGALPGSGYAIRREFEAFDAEKKFPADRDFEGREPAGCMCAEVLRGRAEPSDCPLFATACTPDSPVGACMVSGEGACGAHYRYRGA